MAIQTQTAVLLFIASHPEGVFDIRDGRANEQIRSQINYIGGGVGMSKVLSDLAVVGLITRSLKERSSVAAITTTAGPVCCAVRPER